MTFWDHLEALRWTILRSIIAIAVAMVVLFPFVPWIFDNIILAPTNSEFILYRLFDHFTAIGALFAPSNSDTFRVEIVNYLLSSQLFTHMSVAMWLAFMLVFPYILYELWRFICPALYSNERRAVRTILSFGSIMFYLGWSVGYVLVFPLTLRFLYTYQLSESIANQLSLQSYMDNFMILTLSMGIVFELPVVSFISGRLGLLSRTIFNRYRRHAIVIILIIAAIITPTTDPFTLFAVFIPIYMLWELSALLVPAKR